LFTTLRRLVSWLGDHAWLAPISAVTALFWITVWVYRVIARPAVGWTAKARESGAAIEAYESLTGLLWASSAILFSAITAASIAVLVFTICRSCAEHIRRMPSLGEVALFVVAIMLPLYPVLVPGSPFGGDPYITMELVRKMLDVKVMGVVDVLWSSTMTAAFLVMGGAAACIMGTGHASPIRTGLSADDREGQADLEKLSAALQTQTRRLQAVLFAGAAVLVAGVIELDGLYTWAVSIAELSGYPKNAATVIKASATVSTGTFFSLFLTAAYIPAALILRQRVGTLASVATGTVELTKQSEWLRDHGLSTSLVTQISSVFALLGPILAGAPLNAFSHVFG
jgi:hypothetical protein